jgi:hypothetical protein
MPLAGIENKFLNTLQTLFRGCSWMLTPLIDAKRLPVLLEKKQSTPCGESLRDLRKTKAFAFDEKAHKTKSMLSRNWKIFDF